MSCLDSCKAAACSIAYHILKENARLSTKIFLIICKKGLNYYLIPGRVTAQVCRILPAPSSTADS